MIAIHDLVDVALGRGDAGEMRGRSQFGFTENPRDGRMGALAGRAARAVGDGDEIRIERRQPGDDVPQAALHLFRLRRKELERDRRAFLCPGIRCGGLGRHASELREAMAGVWNRG